jgi:NAD(P)H dehydrogenase (quinone)
MNLSGHFLFMKISIILAHPDKNSFNQAIAKTACEELRERGHEIFFHDLYKEAFDPILTAMEIPKESLIPPEIEKHCRELAMADGIIIIHPNWWGQPPAILKGWIDRVIRPCVAYEFLEGDAGEGIPHGLLKAKAALVFNTSNTETKREQIVFGDPLELIWKNCIFDLCGVKHFLRRMFTIVVTSTTEERKIWLQEVRERVGEFSEKILSEIKGSEKEIHSKPLEEKISLAKKNGVLVFSADLTNDIVDLIDKVRSDRNRGFFPIS